MSPFSAVGTTRLMFCSQCDQQLPWVYRENYNPFSVSCFPHMPCKEAKKHLPSTITTRLYDALAEKALKRAWGILQLHGVLLWISELIFSRQALLWLKQVTKISKYFLINCSVATFLSHLSPTVAPGTPGSLAGLLLSIVHYPRGWCLAQRGTLLCSHSWPWFWLVNVCPAKHINIPLNSETSNYSRVI